MIETALEGAPIAQLRQIANALGSDRRALMRSVAGIMFRAVEDNFEEQGRPKWRDLAESTKESRKKQGTWPGKIMQRSGQLAASVVQLWDEDSARVGSNKAYAAIHQFGGKTKAHIIAPREKKALAFGGIVCRWVYHPGSNIPARPFLSLTDADVGDIVEEAQAHLARAFQALGSRLAPNLPH